MSNVLPLNHEVTPSNQEEQKINIGNFIAPLKKRKMASQIVIKLNKTKYNPLLNEIRDKCHELILSNSELAAFCIFYMHRFCTERFENGKTRAEVIREYYSKREGKELSLDECLIKFMQKFKRFHEGT